MSDAWAYKSSKLMDFGQEKVLVLFARTTEMMERAAALGERVLENILEVDDEELIYIFTNEPLWLDRLEHLNAARYRTGSDLSYIKDELCPDEIFEVKTSMSIAKLVDKKVHHMLRKVKTEMKARNLSLVPGYGEAFISECLDKPQYVGGIAPNIFMFIQEIEKFFTVVRIPLALQGCYIRKNCLSGKALDAVNLYLPVGGQVTKKDIFQILLRKFGNSLYLKRVLMKEHRNIGKIFTHGGELSTLEWCTVNKSCLHHIQLINSFESVLDTLGESVLCPEYLITLKQLLPTEVIFRTVLDTENNLKSTFDIIKEEIIKIENISSQCLIEHEILEITKSPKVVDNFRIEVSGTEKHHGAFKLSVCRVCKLLIPGSNLTPTLHRVTKTGFLIKDQCPHLSTLPHSERSGLLVRNKICRTCLSMKVDAVGHGPEGYCNYLERKNLWHLKCKKNGCRLRKSLCNHSQSDILVHQSNTEHSSDHAATTTVVGDEKSNVAMKKADGVERQTLETRSSKSDCLQDVSNQGITNHALHEMFTIRTVSQENEVEAENEERIDSIKEDNNAIRSEYHKGNVTDYSLNVEANHYEEGTIASEMVAMIRKTLRRQGKGMHKTAYSNVSAIRGIVDTCHKGYRSFQGSNNLFQNSQKILADFKVRQSDPNDCQEKNVFGKAEFNGLSIEKYAFKIFLSRGLRILFDTGQSLF